MIATGFEGTNMNLNQDTLALLDARGDITLREIAAKTQVKYEWLKRYVARKHEHPSVHNVQKIHNLLVRIVPNALDVLTEYTETA